MEGRRLRYEPLYERTHFAGELGGDTVVIARVTGAFPGSPAMRRYRFTLEKDIIVRLEVTA